MRPLFAVPRQQGDLLLQLSQADTDRPTTIFHLWDLIRERRPLDFASASVVKAAQAAATAVSGGQDATWGAAGGMLFGLDGLGSGASQPVQLEEDDILTVEPGDHFQEAVAVATAVQSSESDTGILSQFLVWQKRHCLVLYNALAELLYQLEQETLSIGGQDVPIVTLFNAFGQCMAQMVRVASDAARAAQTTSRIGGNPEAEALAASGWWHWKESSYLTAIGKVGRVIDMVAVCLATAVYPFQLRALLWSQLLLATFDNDEDGAPVENAASLWQTLVTCVGERLGISEPTHNLLLLNAMRDAYDRNASPALQSLLLIGLNALNHPPPNSGIAPLEELRTKTMRRLIDGGEARLKDYRATTADSVDGELKLWVALTANNVMRSLQSGVQVDYQALNVSPTIAHFQSLACSAHYARLRVQAVGVAQKEGRLPLKTNDKDSRALELASLGPEGVGSLADMVVGAVKSDREYSCHFARWVPDSAALVAGEYACLLWRDAADVIKQAGPVINDGTRQMAEALARAKAQLSLIAMRAGAIEKVQMNQSELFLPLVDQWVHEMECNFISCCHQSVLQETWKAMDNGCVSFSVVDLFSMLVQAIPPPFTLQLDLEGLRHVVASVSRALGRGVTSYSMACQNGCDRVIAEDLLPRLGRLRFNKRQSSDDVAESLPATSPLSIQQIALMDAVPLPVVIVRINNVLWARRKLSDLERELQTRLNAAVESIDEVNDITVEGLESVALELKNTTDSILQLLVNRAVFHDLRSVFLGGLYLPDGNTIEDVLGRASTLLETIWSSLDERVVVQTLELFLQAFVVGFKAVVLDGGQHRLFSVDDADTLCDDFESIVEFFVADEGDEAHGVARERANVIVASTRALLSLFRETSEWLSSHYLERPDEQETIFRVLTHRQDPVASAFVRSVKGESRFASKRLFVKKGKRALSVA